MTDWTNEEEEAFNDVEKHSNLGKQILQVQGQPYHWETDAIKAAVNIEREACAKLCDLMWNEWFYVPTAKDCAKAIRERKNK